MASVSFTDRSGLRQPGLEHQWGANSLYPCNLYYSDGLHPTSDGLEMVLIRTSDVCQSSHRASTRWFDGQIQRSRATRFRVQPRTPTDLLRGGEEIFDLIVFLDGTGHLSNSTVFAIDLKK